MNAKQIIFEIDCLPKKERAAVVQHVLEIAAEMVASIAKPRAYCLADALEDGTVTPEDLRKGADALRSLQFDRYSRPPLRIDESGSIGRVREPGNGVGVHILTVDNACLARYWRHGPQHPH